MKKFINGNYAKFMILEGKSFTIDGKRASSFVIPIANLHSQGNTSKDNITKTSFPVKANSTTHANSNYAFGGYPHPLVEKRKVVQNPPRSRKFTVKQHFNFIENPETLIAR